ncbi:MAG: hypothetical protein R3E58_20770 [Phycisphaerae bacterium]
MAKTGQSATEDSESHVRRDFVVYYRVCERTFAMVGFWNLDFGAHPPALWFGLIFAYIVRLGTYWLDRIRDRNRDAQRGSRRAWFVIPVCTLLVISIFVYPWPLVVRFKLSEAAFNQAVEDYQAGAFSSDQWVGLYYVVDTTQVPSSSSRPPEIGFLTGSSLLGQVFSMSVTWAIRWGTGRPRLQHTGMRTAINWDRTAAECKFELSG